MPQPRLPLRLVLLAAAAIGAVLLLGFLVATLNSLLEFYQRIEALPAWLRLPLFALGALALAGLGWLLWRLARPAARSAAPGATPPVSRGDVEQRIHALRERRAETAALEAELHELDRRRASGDVHVALFGEISTGKSSLVRALAPEAIADVDVRGGTTRSVTHHRGRLPDGRELVLADVPGSREVDGAAHEQVARDEATFSALVGLELRPRRLRDAAALWGSLRTRQGIDARDSVWAHPDLLPSAEALNDPLGFREDLGEVETLSDDEFDKALADLLDEGGADDGPESDA